MFGNNKKNGQLNNKLDDKSDAINLIGKGTTINGEINAEGDIRIDGLLKGNVYSKSKVVVGKSGKVEGDIVCQNADVLGTVDGGVVEIEHLLSLKSSAQIKAEIKTKKLVVEPGARFDGNCQMGGIKKGEDNASKKSGRKQRKKKEKE